MNPWFAKAVFIASSIVLVAIRAPHGARSRTLAVARSRKGALETVLLTLMWIAFFLPLVWVVTPLFAFAEYTLHVVPLVMGTLCYAIGLWLFHRSHSDLGRYWSITLEVREGHQLVTHGVYRRVRHPMYLSLVLYSIGQALVIPNWVAGPVYLGALALLLALRLGREERMMREEFGEAYEAYAMRTKRLVPGVW